jgi:hypothetical protein
MAKGFSDIEAANQCALRAKSTAFKLPVAPAFGARLIKDASRV